MERQGHIPYLSHYVQVRHQQSIYRKLPSEDVSTPASPYITAASTISCAVTLTTPAVITACGLFSHQEPSDGTNYFTCVISSLHTKSNPRAGLIHC